MVFYSLTIPLKFELTDSYNRLQSQALSKGVNLVRRPYTSIASVLSDLPATSLFINATGLGSLHLTDVKDTNMYPTRGQTLLVAEPRVPIERMYEYEKLNKYPCPSLTLIPLHLPIHPL